MPGGAPCRAGDREAEDPETPPCEDGLSAASATAGKPAEATASGFPDAALSSLSDPPSAMPPHVTTPHERALLPGGMSHVRTIYEMLSRTISPLPKGRGRGAGERDRVRARLLRRSLLRLLSYGRGPHPCPSPVRVPFGEGFTDLLREALLLPLVGRTDSAEARARRGSPGMKHLTDEGLKVRQPQGPGLTDYVALAPAADARRAGFDREPYARRPPPRSGFARVGPPPQGGRGARRRCENPIARSGEGFARAALRRRGRSLFRRAAA